MPIVDERLDLSGMDLYGIRALTHVATHCPHRFSLIADPVSFFSSLGEEIRAQVEEVEEALMGPLPPPEEPAETTGQWNMARLAAEGQVFEELVYGPFPSEDEDEEEDLLGPDDLPAPWMIGEEPPPPSGWQPLIQPAPTEE
jgi:hypothetical protein